MRLPTLICGLSAILLSICAVQAQDKVPTSEIEIKQALLATPAEKREGASVLGYNQKGELIQLKKGTNEMVCLADESGDTGFSVSCYP